MKTYLKIQCLKKPNKYIWWTYYNESGWGEKVDINF